MLTPAEREELRQNIALMDKHHWSSDEYVLAAESVKELARLVLLGTLPPEQPTEGKKG